LSAPEGGCREISRRHLEPPGCCYKHTIRVDKLAQTGYKCKLRGGEEAPEGGLTDALNETVYVMTID
jgi:hypothetical protein